MNADNEQEEVELAISPLDAPSKPPIELTVEEALIVAEWSLDGWVYSLYAYLFGDIEMVWFEDVLTDLKGKREALIREVVVDNQPYLETIYRYLSDGIDPDFTPGTFESFSDDIKQYLQRHHPLQLSVTRLPSKESEG